MQRMQETQEGFFCKKASLASPKNFEKECECSYACASNLAINSRPFSVVVRSVK